LRHQLLRPRAQFQLRQSVEDGKYSRRLCSAWPREGLRSWPEALGTASPGKSAQMYGFFQTGALYSTENYGDFEDGSILYQNGSYQIYRK